MYCKSVIFCTFLVSLVTAKPLLQCNLPERLVNEINSYGPAVVKIISAAVNGSYSGKLHSDIADFTDTFGNRLAGTRNLENAIDDVIERMTAAGLNVHTEKVKVPTWTRGEEYAKLVSPRKQNLSILGLGLSAGTNGTEITAEVIVVKNFDELKAVAKKVPGKIVLFNAEFVTYEETVQYRGDGPSRASELGAAAALVRTIGPFSINSPHTGVTDFAEGVKPIPAAAISLEDADLIARLAASGKRVVVTLNSGAQRSADSTSRNIIGDLTGKAQPRHYVTLSGHIDSWDVGQGAMDDAGGAFLSWHSLALLKELDLLPSRRTIRAILWTSEEQGLFGANSYLQNHLDELENWSAAFESDLGVFKPLGFNFVGNHDATCVLQQIALLFGSIGATTVQPTDDAGSDIGVFAPLGVPIGEPLMVENNYFWFHHSQGDTMRTLKSEDLDENLALFAATSYILADLSISLPRGDDTVSNS